ncbi:hypothetical protein QAD02_005529 [Eretmocerus hayati]|uniref:Uncharacterized protein n=1 Tax=Eretmocerus hayati TaxID=131215 RepID=A0ACC2NT64_9HYME|nr:hypothetical protein QAD02_005529 [Eretmocerus hayati]
MEMKYSFWILELLSLCLLLDSSDAEPIKSRTTHSVRQEHPFVTLIVEKNSEDITSAKRLCTGSLISRNQILMVNSCLHDKSLTNLLAIVENTHLLIMNLNMFKLSSRITYKDYEEELKREGASPLTPEIDDICILELDVSDTNIIPAAISFEQDAPTMGSYVKFIGWGPTTNREFPKTARYAIVQVLQKQYCDEFAKIFLPRYRKLLWSNKIFCARRFTHPVHPVDGDFGGPILYKESKLIGIVIRPRPFPEKVGEKRDEPVVAKNDNLFWFKSLQSQTGFNQCMGRKSENETLLSI